MKKRSFVLVLFLALFIIWMIGWLLFWTGNRYAGRAPNVPNTQKKDNVAVGLIPETEIIAQ